MLLCATDGQLPPEALETPRAPASEEGEQYSSYGSGESEPDKALQMEDRNGGDAWAESMDDMKRSIAAVDGTLSSIVDKLSALEKVVATVQEDTLWVRGDVRVVHEVVEKLADYVSMLSDTVAVVEGVPGHKPQSVSAWGGWKEDAQALDRGGTEPPAIAEDVDIHVCDEDGSAMHVGHDGDIAIQETQMYENLNTIPQETMTLAGELGAGGWGKTNGAGHALSPPTEDPTAGDDGEDPVLAGCTQMELTIDCTQSGTQAPGRSIWQDFTSTVRDMPGRSEGGGNSIDGWVQSKRGRPSSSNVGGSEGAQSVLEQMAGNTNLNLNLSPENPDTMHTMRGGGLNPPTSGRGPGSRGGGRGGGRGTGRVKRPPAVQPRYSTQASSHTANSTVPD